MRKTRIFIDQKLREGAVVLLPDEAAHHISHVLRLRLGHPLILFNGLGGEFDAEISKVNKRNVEVQINQYQNVDKESSLHITLAQGISRGQKMDFILQKAVELGIDRIIPVMTEYGNVRLDEERQQKKIKHWNGVIIGACEQCGRNKIPDLVIPLSFDECLGMDTGTDRGMTKIVLHSGTGGKLPKLAKPKSGIILLVGPEGGFSDNEIKKACTADYQTIKIGPRILRTETAALAAISACQMLWGDFG